MSWRGVKKSISRLPHQLKTRNGGEDVTKDLEYNALEQCYKELVKSAEDLRLEVIAYRDSLSNMLSYQMDAANHIAEVCGLCPVANEDPSTSTYAGTEYDEKIPMEIKQCLEDYATAMTYCKQEVYTVLDEIDGKVVRPLDKFHEIAKIINKTMVKREHKLIDFDRHRLSYMKYADIQYPTPSEEKNMYKLQTLYDNAACDYDYFNTMLKKELAVFIDMMRDEFLQPVIENFYNAQCRAVGGIYGRLNEVIQQNEVVLRTLNMSIEEGFNVRLAEKNARAELDTLELFKKGLKPWQQKDPSSPSRYRSSPFVSQSRDEQTESDVEDDSRYSTVSSRFSSIGKSRSLSRNPYNGTDGFKSMALSVPDEGDSDPHDEPPALTPRPSVAALRSRLLSNSNNAAPPPYQNSENASTLPSVRKQQSSQPSQPESEKWSLNSKTSSRSSLSAGLTSNTLSTPATPSDTHSLGSSPFSDQLESIAKKKRPPPPPPSKKPNQGNQKNKKELVEALYDLKGPQEGDLSFKVGDLIEVLEKSEEVVDWWKGRLNGQVGMFPANYVRQL